MNRYTTADDAKNAIREALGTEADGHDVDAIFDATHTYMVDRDDDGNELLNTAGFEQTVDDETFWQIVAENAK